MNNKYIFDYTYLAESSYTDFSQLESDYDNLQGNGEKTEIFAELVTNNYTVEAHWKDRGTAFNSESGFSGTLFKGTGHNGGNNGYVLALKGTEGGKDLLAVDAGDIVNDGLAHHQIASAIH